jgi:hypothetical protein
MAIMGRGTEKGVPETVVLTRWRKQQFPNFSFSGEKLSAALSLSTVAWEVQRLDRYKKFKQGH